MTLQQKAAIFSASMLRYSANRTPAESKIIVEVATLLRDMSARITDLERLTNGKTD